MRHRTTQIIVMIPILLGLTIPCALPGERWLHPDTKPLECTKDGPFIQLGNQALLAVEKNILVKSHDGGKTWTGHSSPIHSGMNLTHFGHVGQPLMTRSGTLVILYLDMDTYKWSWNDQRGAPNPDCRLELWSIRSRDGGKTWEDRQQLLDGYNADFMGFIQTRDGALVASVEHMAPDLARWVVCSFRSTDDGKTWTRSNWIDLGGRGHHDGAIEPTITELSDGRLMMLIRTTLDRFWTAYSDDGGNSWREIRPSQLDASSAPGWVRRLDSGRLAFVWNRLKPEGATSVHRREPGPGAASRPSWHREELSVAFSDDDGSSWSKPVVIARETGCQIAYPYFIERKPGVLWVFTRYNWDQNRKQIPAVAVELREKDFVQ